MTSLSTVLAPIAFAKTGDEQINLLVEQARKQGEAGQFTSPVGDNLIETIDKIQSLLPEASEETLTWLTKDLPVLLDQAAAHAAEKLSQATLAQQAATVASIPQPSSSAAASSAPARPKAFIPSSLPAPLATASARPSTLPPPPVQSVALLDDSDNQHRAVMFKRGEEAQRIGDIAAARLWYQAAAHHSHRDAMLALGKLYDPNFLVTMPVIGTVGDPAVAQKWYQEAASLGDPQAPTLLKSLALK